MTRQTIMTIAGIIAAGSIAVQPLAVPPALAATAFNGSQTQTDARLGTPYMTPKEAFRQNAATTVNNVVSDAAAVQQLTTQLNGSPAAALAFKEWYGINIADGVSADETEKLYGLLYKADGTHSAAYANPSGFIGDVTAARNLLTAVRAASGEAAFKQFFGIDAANGLSGQELGALFGLLYKADGTHSAAYSNPSAFAGDLTAAQKLLTTVQATSGGAAAFKQLFGIDAADGLSGQELGALFGLLYKANGTHSAAYSNPSAFAGDLTAAQKLLTTVRATSGGAAAFKQLFSIDAAGGLSGQEIGALFGLLYAADGKKSAAATNPQAFASDAVAVVKLADTVKQSSRGIAAFKGTFKIDVTDGLSGAEIGKLFGQLYNSKGKHTTAFTNPQRYVKNVINAWGNR